MTYQPGPAYQPKPRSTGGKCLAVLKAVSNESAEVEHWWMCTAVIAKCARVDPRHAVTGLEILVRAGLCLKRQKKGVARKTNEWRIAQKECDVEKPTQVVRSAAEAPRVQTTAPSSVFALAGASLPAQPAQPVDDHSNTFRCALFSDGELLVESGGAQMRLPVEHTRALMRYLDRIAEVEGEAS